MEWLWVVLWALGGALLLFAFWATMVGLFGTLFGECFERCPRCHHLGFTDNGQMHPNGCQTLHSRATGLHSARAHHVRPH